MDTEINDNLKKTGTWQRIFYMLVFAVILGFVRMLLWGIVLLQIASSLLTGKENNNVLGFGRSLSVYVYRILLFLTYNTDEMPFPFSDWNSQAPPGPEIRLTEK